MRVSRFSPSLTEFIKSDSKTTFDNPGTLLKKSPDGFTFFLKTGIVRVPAYLNITPSQRDSSLSTI